MASYKTVSVIKNISINIEQNIYDKEELESYTNFKVYNHIRNKKFDLQLNFCYDDYFKEMNYFLSYNFNRYDLERENYQVTDFDLSFINKIKSAEARRKRILQFIETHAKEYLENKIKEK